MSDREFDGTRDLDERFADWVDGRLSPEETRLLEAELAADANLRRAAEDYRSTVALLQEHLDDEDPPADLIPEVMARLPKSNSRLRLLPAVASLAGLAAVVSLMVDFSGSDADQPATEQVALFDKDDAIRGLEPEEVMSNSRRQLGAIGDGEIQTPPVADLENKNRDQVAEAERAELAKKTSDDQVVAGEKVGERGRVEAEGLAEKAKEEAQNELADVLESLREDRDVERRELDADAGVMLRQSWAVEQLARSILDAGPPLAQAERGQEAQEQQRQQAEYLGRLLKSGVDQPGVASESELPVLVFAVDPSELVDSLSKIAGVVGGQRSSDTARRGGGAGGRGRGARGARGRRGGRSRARAAPDEQLARSETLSSYLRTQTRDSGRQLSRAQVVEIVERNQVATGGSAPAGVGRAGADTELRRAGQAGASSDPSKPAGVAAPTTLPEASYQWQEGDQLFLVTGEVTQVQQLLVDVQGIVQAPGVAELAARISSPQQSRFVQVQRVGSAEAQRKFVQPPSDDRANELATPRLSFYMVLRPTK